MIKRKRKRNPIKDDKKLLRKVAELLARAIEKEPDGITAYLLAAELVRRDSLYCEECQSYDIEKGCDWDICYPEIYDLVEESTLDMAKEAAEELAEDLGIVDYVKVFRYDLQRSKYSLFVDKEIVDPSNKNLSELDLSELDLSELDLSESNLHGADLSKAVLSYLNGANLTEANLTEANLTGAYLTGANLSGANLTGANLTRANLILARLNSADLSGTNLSGASLIRTDFSYAKITKSTNFKNANIDKTINLTLPNPRKIHSNEKKKKSTIVTKSNRK